jgi:hypothetical protein
MTIAHSVIIICAAALVASCAAGCDGSADPTSSSANAGGGGTGPGSGGGGAGGASTSTGGTSDNTGSLTLALSAMQAAEAPSSPSLSIAGEYTIEAWIKIAPTEDGYPNFIASKWAEKMAKGYAFAYHSGSLELYCSTDGSSTSSSSILAFLNSETWYHVAVVHLGGQVTFYLDGNVKTVAMSTGCASPFLNQEPFRIGGIGYSGEPPDPEFWNGRIDEVRVWNVARTAGEIASSFAVQLSGAEPGLAAYWPLDGDVDDVSPNGNTLTLVNGATFSADVPFP